MRKRVDLIGLRFGRLVVLCKDGDKAKKHKTYWRCKCDCGNYTSVETSKLRTKNKSTKSCGCLNKEASRKRRHNLTGQKYGKLKVLKFAGMNKARRSTWECLCVCGKKTIKTMESLKKGRATISCGCAQNVKDELGKKYGRLLVIKKLKQRRNGYAYWECLCVCGKLVSVTGMSLRAGTVSCGCAQKDAGRKNIKHAHQKARKLSKEAYLLPKNARLSKYLTDGYVRKILRIQVNRALKGVGVRIRARDLPEEIIETKRQQLKLYRALKEMKNDIRSRNQGDSQVAQTV